ncbi:MAG: phage tail protein [Paracoccaceae bacterium]
MDPMIGTITIFAGNFAPQGWAFCDGAVLQIAEHPALFGILGTTYGGDGLATFALPDMRGRVAAHFGAGAGLARHALGEAAGSETVTLARGLQASPDAAGGAGVAFGAASATCANLQPTLYLAFIIAVEGVFPSRP